MLTVELAVGTAPNLKPWNPGQSGNPSGRVKIPEELRLIKSLSSLEVNKLISKYGRMNLAALLAADTDPETTVIDLSIIAVFKKAFEKQDYTALSFLLERSIGKVPLAPEETDEEKAARDEISNLTDIELARIVAEKLPLFLVGKNESSETV